MHEYSRAVFYYETDQMGFVHHSNYLRWMEEARTDYLNNIGMPYEAFEAHGVFSPVIGATLRYRRPARFGDRVTIRCRMARYSGVRYTVSYTVHNQDDQLLAEAESEHAFINAGHRPVSLAKAAPEIHTRLSALFPEA